MKISRSAKWCCAVTFLALVVAFGVNWVPTAAQEEKKEEAKATEAAPTAEKTETKTEAKTETKEDPKTEGATPTPATETKVVLPGYMTQSNPDPTKPLAEDPIGANSGYWTTPAPGPVGDGDPAAMTPAGLYDRIVHNMLSINMLWVLIAGCLVMFMQAGFAMVEGGLCRAKNSSHTFAMNMMIYPLGCIAFWAYGFALGWGNWFAGPVPSGYVPPLGPGMALLNSGFSLTIAEHTYGLIGTKGFCLMGLDDTAIMAYFFYMMVFMDTTATIPTGTMAERWSWKNFCLYGLWVALPYCIFANWVWGGGWLAQSGVNWGLGHGAVDFAGSGVVHAMGGAIALAGGIVIGPRVGKYIDKKPQAIPGHSIPMVIIGTFILAFGWFGFNGGSTLAGTDLRMSTVIVNTMLASVTGALSCMVYMMATGMKPDPSMMCNGMLAGLVAVTAPCAFIDSWAAALIGAIAGVLVVVSVFFWDRIGIDDPVGAISVHGVNGVWGVISVGLFANGKYGLGWAGVERAAYDKNPAVLEDGVRGLFYGDASQLLAQLLDAGVVVVFGFVMAYVWFKLSNLITPLRVPEEVEVQGLDGPEMGALGYPDFVQK